MCRLFLKLRDRVIHYLKTKGKEHKYGGIESNFTIVVWASNDYSGDDVVFQMTAKPNKHNTAKAPADMFPDAFPNSMAFMIEAQEKYYG